MTEGRNLIIIRQTALQLPTARLLALNGLRFSLGLEYFRLQARWRRQMFKMLKMLKICFCYGDADGLYYVGLK